MRKEFQILAAMLLAMLLAFFHFKTGKLDQYDHQRFHNSLRKLKTADSDFSDEVLRARVGMVEDADDFAKHGQEMARLVAEIKVIPGFVDGRDRYRIMNLMGEYSSILQRRIDLLADFQSQGAILDNALASFPAACDELSGKTADQPGLRDLEAEAGNLSRQVLSYSLNPGENPSSLQAGVEKIGAWVAAHPGNAASPAASALLAHARTILERKPVVDRLTREIVTLPSAEKLEKISVIYQSNVTRTLDQAAFYRVLLYVLCGAFALCAAYAVAVLKAINRNLEERVIERTSELSRTNENLQKEIVEKRHVQNELVEASRVAGMAEVATSVLHNVGNVLNSINVSATLISEKLRKLKVDHISKVAALMQEHAGDIGFYMTQDAKGRHLPGFLGQLAVHWAEERTSLLHEIASLSNNVDHVKDIVAMQQDYARLSDSAEVVSVTEMVEDALRFNEGTLRTKGVSVSRDYAKDIPEISVERHKALQILVNLIRNAKQSCEESGKAEKRLAVRAERRGDLVAISIADNGVGIPAEFLNKIFNHGFTTKKQGHGFGLHSAILGAKEMGGALTVSSEGAGKGATFTLELPLRKA